jgi:hypothetical protein
LKSSAYIAQKPALRVGSVVEARELPAARRPTSPARTHVRVSVHRLVELAGPKMFIREKLAVLLWPILPGV